MTTILQSIQALDVTTAQSAHALGVQHRSALEPRLPAGMIDALAADLTTVGASSPAVASPAPAASPGSPATPASLFGPSAQALSLEDALSNAARLLTAVHEAVQSTRPGPALRKAYGVGSRSTEKEVGPLIAAVAKVVARARARPSEALALGVLPADVTALDDAARALTAAEAAAHGPAPKEGLSAKVARAAIARIHTAVERIAGASILAFALQPDTRALFEALRTKSKKAA